MDYTPHTEEEIREMLRRVGAASLEDLFAHLPKEILSPPIDLPEPLPEWKVLEELRRLAAQNLRPQGLPGRGGEEPPRPPRGPGPGRTG